MTHRIDPLKEPYTTQKRPADTRVPQGLDKGWEVVLKIRRSLLALLKWLLARYPLQTTAAFLQVWEAESSAHRRRSRLRSHQIRWD